MNRLTPTLAGSARQRSLAASCNADGPHASNGSDGGGGVAGLAAGGRGAGGGAGTRDLRHAVIFASTSRSSTSQMATMFWLMTARAFAAPMPLMPTIAMFTRSLGGVRRWPSTWRGTIIQPAAATAPVAMNSRRVLDESGLDIACWGRGHYRSRQV